MSQIPILEDMHIVEDLYNRPMPPSKDNESQESRSAGIDGMLGSNDSRLSEGSYRASLSEKLFNDIDVSFITPTCCDPSAQDTIGRNDNDVSFATSSNLSVKSHIVSGTSCYDTV